MGFVTVRSTVAQHIVCFCNCEEHRWSFGIIRLVWMVLERQLAISFLHSKCTQMSDEVDREVTLGQVTILLLNLVKRSAARQP
jgi:hypothetical protein